MTILITGAAGQLGSVMKETLSNSLENKIIALNKDELDITDIRSIETAFDKYQPKWVINTAAFTAVDDAESELEKAFALNATAVEYLAQHCAQYSAKLIHFSTDYVFDGKKQGAYSESDLCNPETVYGKTKLAGEQMLRENLDDHIILRISWIFSSQGNNFVKGMSRILKEKPFITVVNDQHGCPTSAKSVAKLVKAIIQEHPTLCGTFHYSNQPATTRYDFTVEIQKQLIANHNYELKPIYPTSSKDFAAKAKRPLNSVLACTKIEKMMNHQALDWRQELTEVLGELHNGTIHT